MVSKAKNIIKFIKEDGLKDGLIKSWYYFRYKNIIFNCNVLLQKYNYKENRVHQSQGCEDLFIHRYFNYKKKGFYVDVGANHPSSLSNTKIFYDIGWRGINIDPNNELIRLFNDYRSEDLNICKGIGSVDGELIFYRCSDHTLSTYDESVANDLIDRGFSIIKEKTDVGTLKNILSEHSQKDIDFLSIDTEGFNFEVLHSNDRSIYRPNLVLIEDDDILGRSYDDFFSSIGYTKIFYNGLNIIFKRN